MIASLAQPMTGRLAGVALQLAALAVFVCMDTMLKLLTAHFAVPQLMWARFFFSLIAAALFFRLVTGRLPWRSKAPWLQAARSLLLAGSNLMFSSALVHLPLTDCTAIGFASPLFTVALAAVWLKERVGPRRWVGVGIGFLGVLVALRPPFLTGGEPVHWAAILPLGTAAMFAVYSILTRKLATIDDPRTTILHTGFAGAIVRPAWRSPSSGSRRPGRNGRCWSGSACWARVGHGLLVLAFARAPASLLAPMSYTQLIWATVAGVLVFADWPDLADLGRRAR